MIEFTFVNYELNENVLIGSIVESKQIKVLLDKEGALFVETGTTYITVKHPDNTLLSYLQFKFMKHLSHEKRLDVVDILSKHLSLSEIQDLNVVMFRYSKEIDITPLIALVAMREEPSKVKWLQMPKVGNEANQNKANQSNRFYGGKKR